MKDLKQRCAVFLSGKGYWSLWFGDLGLHVFCNELLLLEIDSLSEFSYVLGFESLLKKLFNIFCVSFIFFFKHFNFVRKKLLQEYKIFNLGFEPWYLHILSIPWIYPFQSEKPKIPRKFSQFSSSLDTTQKN